LIPTVWSAAAKLRCPLCEEGVLFAEGLKMYETCPQCGVRFERADGESTGAMMLLSMVTTMIVLVGGYMTEMVLHWPLDLQLLLWVGVASLFPRLFYRNARGLWVALLHLTGALEWDEPAQDRVMWESQAWGNMQWNPVPVVASEARVQRATATTLRR
jgi:uncharacterized protein (DUF983 family)